MAVMHFKAPRWRQSGVYTHAEGSWTARGSVSLTQVFKHVFPYFIQASHSVYDSYLGQTRSRYLSPQRITTQCAFLYFLFKVSLMVPFFSYSQKVNEYRHKNRSAISSGVVLTFPPYTASFVSSATWLQWFQSVASSCQR